MVLTMRTLAGALLATPVVALLVSAAVAPLPPPTQEYCDAHYGQPVGKVFTWRTFTFQTYLGAAGCETHRQGTYLTSGVSINAAGDLVISARRHCTSGPVLESTPVTEAPCEGLAQYSVGRGRPAALLMPAPDVEGGVDVALPHPSAPR